MYPHRIRLLGPWDCEPLGPPGSAVPPARRVTPPLGLVRQDFAGFSGRVRITRRFGYPGRIDVYEHVWLVITDLADCIEMVLNEHPLAAPRSGAFEAEVTSLLAPRNRLDLKFDLGSDAARLGEVALEVRRDAFLRNVEAIRLPDGAIRISGQVVGAGVAPLELYVLVDGRTVHYGLVDATPEGRPFDFTILPEAPAPQIRVELIAGAERWDAVEAPVSEPHGR